MRTDTARSYRRVGAAVGMALRSYADRVHYIPDPKPGQTTQRTACGRQAVIVDDPEGLTECRQCWPNGGLEQGLYAIWDICDDLDARYNNTIRDSRPLRSIL